MDSYSKIIARWKKAPQEDIFNPPKTGGGGVQNQLYDKFKAAMFNTNEIKQLTEKWDRMKKQLADAGGLIS
jgi:hypothetical protein